MDTMEKAECYPEVNKAFKATSRIVLGEEIGELKDFDAYLSEILTPLKAVKSMKSGKDLAIGAYYPDKAKFISADEAPELKPVALDVNAIKDIDSLLEAVQEVFVYSGNRQFGKNAHQWMTDIATDSQYVMKSHNVVQLKLASHTCYCRESDNVFGHMGNAYSHYTIRCAMGSTLTRCWEAYNCANSSDLHYCFRCDDSSDCMFSFGLMGGHYAIGNNVLPRGKYVELRKKLLAEMAEELRRKKTFPSILELPQHYRLVDPAAQVGERVAPAPCTSSLDEAFGKTTKLVLGESLSPIYRHEQWLAGINQFGIRKVVAAFGRPTMKHEQGSFWKLHPERFTREDKFYEIADSTRLPNPEARLEGLMQDLAKRIYFTCTIVVNPSSGIVDTPYAIRSNDVYWGMGVEAKHVAYTIGIKSSNVFGGGGRIVECDFDVNCYDSVGLTRCLEVDGSYNTTDSLYCHNCRNVSDALFSFNATGKDHIVANTPVGKENFVKAKRIVLDYVVDRLRRGEKVEELHLFSVPKWR